MKLSLIVVIMIDTYFLQNPPEFITGVRQDVARYSVMAEGVATQTVSASTACPSVNCSHLLLLAVSSSQPQIKGSVAADNVFGRGSSCTLQELQPGMLLIVHSG